MARIDLAWELGGNLGHVSVMLPMAHALAARGHAVRMMLREHDAGADLPSAQGIPRAGAPIWVGPTPYPNPVNFGQLLLNFGYGATQSLVQLLDAWRERLAGADLVIANVAPSAHLAARTLGIPSVEISQGFHVPPPSFPTPVLREWEAPPVQAMAASDEQALAAINTSLAARGAAPIRTLGDLFLGRTLLLTYPELDTYARSEALTYLGIVPTGTGGLAPHWPSGSGPRVFAYVQNNYPGMERLARSLRALDVPTLAFFRGLDAAACARLSSDSVLVTSAPMSVSDTLPQADIVVCHASHQMTAQALLAGKPLLLLPTHVEQMLNARRVERIGAGIAIAPYTDASDFDIPLAILVEDDGYRNRARAFAARYAQMPDPIARIVTACEALTARAAGAAFAQRAPIG